MSDLKSVGAAFTRGLMAGYASETPPPKGERGGFPIQSTHYEHDGLRYHDEWVGGESGGGQELVEVEGERWLRTYYGGMVSANRLAEIGTTKAAVEEFHKKILREFASRTRLFRTWSINEDPFSYEYAVTQDRELGITEGEERILFRGRVVFRHKFAILPIR